MSERVNTIVFWWEVLWVGMSGVCAQRQQGDKTFVQILRKNWSPVLTLTGRLFLGLSFGGIWKTFCMVQLLLIHPRTLLNAQNCPAHKYLCLFPFVLMQGIELYLHSFVCINQLQWMETALQAILMGHSNINGTLDSWVCAFKSFWVWMDLAYVPWHLVTFPFNVWLYCLFLPPYPSLATKQTQMT